MASRRLQGLMLASGLVWLLGSGADSARAGEPYLGIDLGVAAPTEKFRKTADVGGVIAAHAGYRLFTLADSFALSVEGTPQFAAFPIQSGVSTKGRDIESLFSFTAGPKFSLMDDIIEAYFSAGGGYYTHTTGVVDDDGGGWYIAGGLNYQLGNGNLLGLFARRDQANMRPVKGPSTDDTTYFTGGLSFTHLFLQEEPVAPVPPPPAPPVAAAPAPVKKKIVLRGVNFDFDQAKLRADAKPILDEAIATLQQTPEVNVEVEGHTDDVGSEAYNKALSERRARAVADYLTAGGVSRARLNTVGFGENRPLTSNDTAAGRGENRRVELRVSEE